MNKKSFLIVFALLSIAITVYPPYHWNTDVSLIDNATKMQLPIKNHEFLFGPSIKKFELKHYPTAASDTRTQNNSPTSVGKPDLSSYSDEELELIAGIIPLKRSIATTDFLLEYLIAFLLSVGIAVAHDKFKKNQ